MIKFVQSSPTSGDCTAAYDVILDKAYTVREFVDYVFTNQKNEWGNFTFCGIFAGRSYHYGKWDEAPLPDEVMEQTIKKIEASGGWSCMDYYITLDVATKTDNRGGARVGSGRKKYDEAEKRVSISCRIDPATKTALSQIQADGFQLGRLIDEWIKEKFPHYFSKSDK